MWSNQYIDLALLISDYVPETTITSTSQSLLFSQPPPLKTNSAIEQWSDAFLIFIYTDHCPADIQGILKYIQIIRNMASHSTHHIVLAYDRDFRKLRAHIDMPWATLHQELFSSVSRQSPVKQSHAFPPTRPSGVRPQPFPKGYCFAYCSNGRSNKANMLGSNAGAMVLSLSSHALLSPSIVPPSLSNDFLSRVLNSVHATRLLQLLQASNYDAALSTARLYLRLSHFLPR